MKLEELLKQIELLNEAFRQEEITFDQRETIREKLIEAFISQIEGKQV